MKIWKLTKKRLGPHEAFLWVKKYLLRICFLSCSWILFGLDFPGRFWKWCLKSWLLIKGSFYGSDSQALVSVRITGSACQKYGFSGSPFKGYDSVGLAWGLEIFIFYSLARCGKCSQHTHPIPGVKLQAFNSQFILLSWLCRESLAETLWTKWFVRLLKSQPLGKSVQ